MTLFRNPEERLYAIIDQLKGLGLIEDSTRIKALLWQELRGFLAHGVRLSRMNEAKATRVAKLERLNKAYVAQLAELNEQLEKRKISNSFKLTGNMQFGYHITRKAWYFNSVWEPEIEIGIYYKNGQRFKSISILPSYPSNTPNARLTRVPMECVEFSLPVLAKLSELEIWNEDSVVAILDELGFADLTVYNAPDDKSGISYGVGVTQSEAFRRRDKAVSRF